MKKITFIGAGSFGFTRGLVRDIFTFPALKDSEICLMDINEERLSFIQEACEKIKAAGNYPATITSTLDRAEALRGADAVIITILSGGPEVFASDIEIPKKYGVDTNVGDTRGPSGIFRFLRTSQDMLAICRDVEKYCPKALVLNYTNPMAMLCRYLQSETSVNVTGLCHSVQGTAEMLAGFIGADMKDVTYLCGGINHQAFYLNFRVNGEDAYPQLRAAMEKPEVRDHEMVRNEMYKHLDFYCTESSGHNSEYNAWFRKRPDLIEKYCTHGTGWNPGVYAYILNEYRGRANTWKDEIKEWLNKPNSELDIERGEEYAAYIINAMMGDGKEFVFNGNVRNFGLIDNLPKGCCVEVPILASTYGLQPIHVGELPPQLALLINTSAQIEELAVAGCIEKCKRKIFHAILFDPLTAAVLSMQETYDMVEEMFAANKEFLGDYK